VSRDDIQEDAVLLDLSLSDDIANVDLLTPPAPDG
jgi:hypothetical protein